jgi:hypothetical protein
MPAESKSICDDNVRARMMYYHQVGYFAMGVQEPQSERRALITIKKFRPAVIDK